MSEFDESSDGGEFADYDHTDEGYYYDGDGFDGVDETDDLYVPCFYGSKELQAMGRQLAPATAEFNALAALLGACDSPLQIATEIGSDTNVWGATLARSSSKD